jgi:hypothetical protein
MVTEKFVEPVSERCDFVEKVGAFARRGKGLCPLLSVVSNGLDFSARQPEVTVIEAVTGSRGCLMSSDQNYLAIHIVLSFALQHFFEISNSPVPDV